MAKRELSQEEKGEVAWYAHCINGNKHNVRMLESKYISDQQAEKNVLDSLFGAEREKFLAAKQLAKEV